MSAYNSAYGRKKSGGAIFVLFAIGVVLTLGLYFVKTRAQTAKAQAAGLERQLAAEQAEIFKLRSELAHLENPARVDGLATETLGLRKTAVEQVIDVRELDQKFPLKNKLAAEVQP